MVKMSRFQDSEADYLKLLAKLLGVGSYQAQSVAYGARTTLSVLTGISMLALGLVITGLSLMGDPMPGEAKDSSVFLRIFLIVIGPSLAFFVSPIIEIYRNPTICLVGIALYWPASVLTLYATVLLTRGLPELSLSDVAIALVLMLVMLMMVLILIAAQITSLFIWRKILLLHV